MTYLQIYRLIGLEFYRTQRNPFDSSGAICLSLPAALRAVLFGDPGAAHNHIWVALLRLCSLSPLLRHLKVEKTASGRKSNSLKSDFPRDPQ